MSQQPTQTPDSDREIYPNAPLQFVALEVVFPFQPAYTDEAVQRRLYQSLAAELPVARPVSAGPVVRLQMGEPAGPPPPSPGSIYTMVDRKRRRSIRVTPTTFLVQTSDYERFES